MPGSGQLGAKMASPALLLASNRVFVKRADTARAGLAMGLPRGLACNLTNLAGVPGSNRSRSMALAPRLRRCGLDLES